MDASPEGCYIRDFATATARRKHFPELKKHQLLFNTSPARDRTYTYFALREAATLAEVLLEKRIIIVS